MLKDLLVGAALSITSHQAQALNIACVDKNIQDSQVTAHFAGMAPSISVVIGIPTGETSLETATGLCVAEEDTAELSLRCDDVVSATGEKYFARIDGQTARVSKGGVLLATVPCDN